MEQLTELLQLNFGEVLEEMTDGLCVLDHHHAIRYMTHKGAALLELAGQEDQGPCWSRSFPLSAHPGFCAACRQAVTTGKTVWTEEYLPCCDTWLSVRVFAHQELLFVQCRDITGEKKDRQRLELLARTTLEVLWERQPDSDEVLLDREKAGNLFGYHVGSNRIPRSFWLEKIHPDDRPEVERRQTEALQTGLDFYSVCFRLLKADGSWCFITDRVYIARDAQHRPLQLIGAMEDVTAQKEAEQVLRESEMTYRQFFYRAPYPMYVYDKEAFRFLDVNKAALDLYGYSRKEFLSKNILDIRPPGEHQKAMNAARRINREHPKDIGVWIHEKKNGERIMAEISVAEVVYKNKKANLSTVKDVTDKLRLQEQLTREKVARQKEVTKAIIETQEAERSEIGKELHDNVNQLLATAKLYVENIRYYPEQSAGFIQKSAAILQDSITELRRLSRALVTPTIRDIGFKDTLHEMVASYEELNLFEVVCDCAFNERAVPKGIKLTIYRMLQEAFSNTVKYARASQVRVSIRHSEGWLRLIYEDDGVGFNHSTVKKGLGLTNIKNRAGAYGGKVQVYAAEGAGCTLKVTFPLPHPEDAPSG